ncbi:MAG: H-type lectin domain-containing protein [Paracoccus sp. (in: a-proteobacteria)]|nr:H-type lectin domain-containing protein [Paracoccus sp. (in: a-proteobacteria)]
MKRISNYAVGVQQGSEILFSDFENGGEMWTGSGRREYRRDLRFGRPFRALPAVHVGLGMWDISNAANLRADICAEDITREGFTLVFRTWGDTRVARIRADWLAIGAADHEDDWDI